MKNSLLKHVLDNPVESLKRIGKPPPRLESLRLYREILKMSNEFTWSDEKGRPFRQLIRESARNEFELARDERDPLLVMKMILTSREAIL
jgi:hypothetical protein